MTASSLKPLRKLVIFDVEGVLLPKNRYLIFEAGQKLSFFQFVQFLFVGFLYEIRLLPLESALRRVFKLFRGFSVEELVDAFVAVPMLPFAEEVFEKLREKGLKTALISSGLPQVLVNNLTRRLNADYGFGLDLDIKQNRLTGNIGGAVIGRNGKDLVMNRILEREGLTKNDCVVVADDRNNASIFCSEAVKIGYNPDFIIAFKSDYVIKENLLEILPIIEGRQKSRPFSLSRNGLIREAIHASGFLIVFLAMYLGVYKVAFLLSLITLGYTASELARIQRMQIPFVSQVTLNAATFSERYEFATAPIFFALGITLALTLFPTPINFVSVAVLTLGDSAAAVFGQVFGDTPIAVNKGKNLEGSIAGVAFAFLGVALCAPALPLLYAFVGAVVSMFVEVLPLPINDNLSIPLVTGVVLMVLLQVF